MAKPFQHNSLPNPDMVGSSEYHAIYDVLETAEDMDHARGILDEFEHQVRGLRAMMGLDQSELAGRIAAAFPHSPTILKKMVEETTNGVNANGLAAQLKFLIKNGVAETTIIERLKTDDPPPEL